MPGHGYVSDYAEVVEYRDMVTVIRDTIQELIDKGLTLEQVKAANPTKGYRGRYGIRLPVHGRQTASSKRSTTG